MNTLDLINAWKKFSDDEKALLSLAICTRGKNKGYLLSNKPKNKRAAIVWNQFMMNIAPVRASLWPIMTNDEPELALTVDALITPMFRYAINATEPAFRWNLWAHRYDGKQFMGNLKEDGEYI